MTVIMINNFIYGMTGGQLAPTAPLGSIATTAPYGNIEHPFDICNLACALGANYVARWGVSHPYQPIKSIKEGIQKKGFSLLEFLAPCPTAYGRRNKLGDIKKHWQWYDDNTILIEDYDRIMKYGKEEEKNEQYQELLHGGDFPLDLDALRRRFFFINACFRRKASSRSISYTFASARM